MSVILSVAGYSSQTVAQIRRVIQTPSRPRRHAATRHRSGRQADEGELSVSGGDIAPVSESNNRPCNTVKLEIS